MGLGCFCLSVLFWGVPILHPPNKRKKQKTRHSFEPQAMLRPHFSAPSALRQLSYLDTVSTVSLQRYNLHLYDFASELGISTLAGLTDDLLFNAMKAEWLASPDGTLFWNYVQNPVPNHPQTDGHVHDQGHEGWAG